MFRRLACIILLFFNTKYVRSSDSSAVHYCLDNNNKNINIEMVQLCDNISNCLHGSDESTVLCKRNEPSWDTLFQCANGVLINLESKCDGTFDCLDRSDESVLLCWSNLHETDQKNYTIQRRDICEEHKVQCPHSEKCINETQRCDNIIDCLNGWDESTEVCMHECNDEEFLCGNGKCIFKQYLCNNEPDCIDGSDELPVICKDPQQNPNHANWLHKEPAYCSEPTKQNLKFYNDTKYYSHPTEKFVYANMAVRFECYYSKIIISGSEWNICNNTGQWHYPLPQCEKVNTDPETNGAKGCPIDTYNDYKDTLKLSDCNGGKCVPILPNQTNSKNVKFECGKGFDLWPDLRTRACKDNKWVGNETFRSPRCVKFCKPEELYCLDSSKPACRDELDIEIQCKASNGLPPQTTAIIGCNPGFKLVNPIKVTCLENGTWENISKIKEACTFECRYEIGLSKNNPHIKLEKAKPIVFLYLYNKTTSNYDYICGGTIIRPNVILTAAHCVADQEMKHLRVIRSIGRPYINETEGWEVEKNYTSYFYDRLTHSGDLAILQLKPGTDDMSYAICLPGYSYEIDNDITPTYGRIYTLDTLGNEANIVGNLTQGTVEVNEMGSNNVTLEVKLSANRQFCRGDSGSGFIADCLEEKVKYKCLFGVVSTSKKGTDGDLACGPTITLSRTTHVHSLDFIRKKMKLIEDTCHFH